MDTSDNIPLIRRNKDDKKITSDKLDHLLLHVKDASMGIINSVLTIPCMFGYSGIIYSHPAFRLHIGALSKLILFSAAVHQIVFTLMSTMPFAIGQVQDAGLIFLCAIATSLANMIHSAEFSSLDLSSSLRIQDSNSESLNNLIIDYASASTTTAIVCISICTCTLGLALVIMGKAKLAKYVNYIPISVISGYLAFIGIFCIQAGLGLSSGLVITNPSQWGQLLTLHHLILITPALLSGGLLAVIARKVKHPAAMPLVMIVLPLCFYFFLFLNGYSLEDARAGEWVNYPTSSASVSSILGLFDLSKVRWYTMPSQILQWAAMTFVVAFSSCLDVAAIELDLGRSLNIDVELTMIGYSNAVTGLSAGYTGSYIFSQTIFSSRSRVVTRTCGWIVALSELAVFFAPFDVLALVPRFFFGATLIFIGLDLCFEYLVEICVKKRVSPHEHSVCLFTFVAMIFTNIEIGLVLGVIAAAVHFMICYVQTNHITLAPPSSSSVVLPLDTRRVLDASLSRSHGCTVVNIDSYLFFGSAESVLDKVKRALMVTVKVKDNDLRVMSYRDFEPLFELDPVTYTLVPPEMYRSNTFKSLSNIEDGYSSYGSTDGDHKQANAQLICGLKDLCLNETSSNSEIDFPVENNPNVAISPSLSPPVPTQCLILDCTRVIGLDSTALKSFFLVLSHIARSNEIDLVFTGLSPNNVDILQANGVFTEQDTVNQHKSSLPVANPPSGLSNCSDVSDDSELYDTTHPFYEYVYRQFALEETLPSIEAPWGTVCSSSTVESALRWNEARIIVSSQ